MDRDLAPLLSSLSPGGRDKLLRAVSAVPQRQETPDMLRSAEESSKACSWCRCSEEGFG